LLLSTLLRLLGPHSLLRLLLLRLLGALLSLLLLGLLDARPLRRLFRERLASLCDAGHC